MPSTISNFWFVKNGQPSFMDSQISCLFKSTDVIVYHTCKTKLLDDCFSFIYFKKKNCNFKIVDARNGYDSMVYIADVTGFGIIVFDYANKKSWRAESQSNHLRPNQQYSNFTIAGESFNLMDGVFGMAVSPKTC